MMVLRVAVLLTSATSALSAVAHGQTQLHLHLRARQVPPAPTPAAPLAAEYEDPDKLAMDTFVQKCTVSFSVQNSDNLPTDALRNFCESTDAVMECRLKLLEPLKEAHKHGGSMMVFCAKAYNWFQMKYGMYCPTQCHKMQCKSTCEWLDEKKALDWEGEELEESSADVAGSRKELDELQGELVDAREAATMRNRSVAQEQVKLARADAALKDRQHAREWQANVTNQIDVVVQSLETQKEDLALNITSDEDTLAELKMRVEKAELANHLLRDEQQHLSSEAGEAAAKMTDSEHQLQKSEEEVRVLEEMTSEENRKAQEIEQKVDNATAEVNDRRVKLESAQAQLDAANANSTETTAEVNELLDLVRQQKQRFDAARESFRVLDRELASKRISLEHSRQDIATYRNGTAALRNETDALRRAVVALEEQLVAKDTELQAGNNASTLLTSEVTNRTAALNALKEQAAAVDRSLELQRGYQQQQHEALEKAQSAESQAHDELKLQEAELGQEFHALQEAAQAMGEALHKVAEERQRWESENGGLVHALAAHKEKERDLEHRKPEIVRMHGLGLLQLLG